MDVDGKNRSFRPWRWFYTVGLIFFLLVLAFGIVLSLGNTNSQMNASELANGDTGLVINGVVAASGGPFAQSFSDRSLAD
ncbi:MAG: hypothetical protein HKL80_05975, partial [Acidimicrobiales bacterium]|nr:hypothetical protein [Acidimicrobiales bacterium]